jgi:hypothetical protein
MNSLRRDQGRPHHHQQMIRIAGSMTVEVLEERAMKARRSDPHQLGVMSFPERIQRIPHSNEER